MQIHIDAQAADAAFRRELLARLTALSQSALDARPSARQVPAPAERLFRPLKRVVTMRLDADVLAWFKRRAPRGYQTEINRALRRFAEAEGEGGLDPSAAVTPVNYGNSLPAPERRRGG